MIRGRRGFPLSRAFKRSTQLGKALRASSFIHAGCTSMRPLPCLRLPLPSHSRKIKTDPRPGHIKWPARLHLRSRSVCVHRGFCGYGSVVPGLGRRRRDALFLLELLTRNGRFSGYHSPHSLVRPSISRVNNFYYPRRHWFEGLFVQGLLLFSFPPFDYCNWNSKG